MSNDFTHIFEIFLGIILLAFLQTFVYNMNMNVAKKELQCEMPQMTVDQARAELSAELKKGEHSIKHGKHYTLAESKAMLGL
jgi:hypothetical protein